jgi:hypothetical protein
MKSPETWERVRLLFHATLEQPAEARSAFLTSACDDERLRREVESLLAAAAAAGEFLETPAVNSGASRTAPELAAGSRVGIFEVIGSLGSGGMGEVYSARDARLGRTVAIKLLPRALAADPHRLARFERESRILATLNHPHIATIHSIEHVDGLHLLVLELLEGPTLADRLTAGALPQAEALTVGRELAGALEAAHDSGVVHRDVKPSNIKFTRSGSLKLLDFGLAKEAVAHAAPGQATLPQDAVLKTVDGLILGTCAYMSPEQARGKDVNRQTDIWAFGCVLFEMLTGRRAFSGDTMSDTIAAVLDREPEWMALPETVPVGVVRLIRRCLEKDPHRRLHDIADARLELEDALAGRPDGIRMAPRQHRLRFGRFAAVVVLASVIGALGWLLRGAAVVEPGGPGTVRFTWPLPADMRLASPPVVSPDGQQIAFTAASAEGPPRLFVRPLAAVDARPIAGTEGATHPFWSPDGRALGYFARGRLMRIAVDGGAAVEICTARAGYGGAWSTNDVIVFTPDVIDAGLWRVSARGGSPEPLTLLDRTQGENSHRWPVFLPDGVHFLYFVRSHQSDRRGVYVGRADRPAAIPGMPLYVSGADARYVPLDGDGGVLLSEAGGRLEARSFDAVRQMVIGDPSVLDIPTAGVGRSHAAMFGASLDVLAHVSAPIPGGQRLALAGAGGKGIKVWERRETLNWPRLSRDGRRLAYQGMDSITGSGYLWVEDLERGNRFRLTKDGEVGLMPIWAPDDRRVAYATGTVQKSMLSIAGADGSGVTAVVPCPGMHCFPTDWSPDGRWLLANVSTPAGMDVWMLSTDISSASRPLLAESFDERDARFSLDGRFVAYVSQETGRPEVTVRAVAAPPAREILSVAGGDQPVWSRDGRELFFVDFEGALRRVSVLPGSDGRLVFGRAVPVDVPRIGSGHWGTQYDVAPNGQRIFFLDRRLEPSPSEIGIVLGWRALMK